MSYKKVSIKKHLVGAAHGFNLRFLNLFRFSISVSFVWCIIQKIWKHLGKVTAVFGEVFLSCNSAEKQLLNFRNVPLSHCFRNLSLTILWNNSGLSYYKSMRKNLEFRK